MDAVLIRILPMPFKIKGTTTKDESEDYNIYLHSDTSDEARVRAFRHEIEHIRKGGFSSDDNVELIERQVASCNTICFIGGKKWPEK